MATLEEPLITLETLKEALKLIVVPSIIYLLITILAKVEVLKVNPIVDELVRSFKGISLIVE